MRELSKTIIRFAKPHKWLFILLFFCIVVTSFSGAFYPYIFGKLVDEVFYNKNMDVFIRIVLIYAAVYFSNAFLHFILNMSWAKLMTKFLFDIREAAFYKALKLKPQFLSNANTGDLVERINNDVSDFMNLIHWNIFYTTATVISLIVTLVIVFKMNFWFFLIMLVLIPITGYFSKHYRDKTNKLYRDIANKNGLITGWIYEIVKGVSEIKMLNANKRVKRSFLNQSAAVVRMVIDASWVSVKSSCVTNGLTTVSRIIMFILAGGFVYKGEMTIGAFIASLDYFNNGVSYFKSLNAKSIEITKNMSKIRRVNELLNYETEKYEGTELLTEKADITFKNVSFSYENSERVLRGVTFHINSGETIALCGKSGVGKSTIASLILGMLRPDAGKLIIGSMDISACSLESIRTHISIVLQEVLLFDGSIRENLLMAKADAKDGELWTALENASLADFVRSLENKLDTVIGVNGMDFSGGQRQRLSIARIFLKNPKIVILDEATSSLDSETEGQIQAAWQRLRKNRTTIIIAHRYSTIKNADRVLVLDKGSVAAFGSHDELIENSEAYNRLFAEQFEQTDREAVR